MSVTAQTKAAHIRRILSAAYRPELLHTRMIRFNEITLREISLPLKEPFRISSGLVHERRIVLLELTDRDGATAWSECVAFQLPFYSPETIDTA